MKVGLVQYDIAWENPIANIDKINKLVAELKEIPEALIFPELSLTGFTMNSKKFAEEFDGISFQFFRNLASQLKTNIFCGIIEKDKSQIFNSLIHYNESGLLMARYRKIHPYTPSGESDNYNDGNELVVTEINKTKIALSVCYDLRFPELFRLYSKKNIDVIITIANWPVPRIEHWRTLLKARAIENQAFTIGVNRVGSDPKNIYNGFSSIYNPLGQELLCKENEDGIFICELDLHQLKETRASLPFLEDMKLI